MVIQHNSLLNKNSCMRIQLLVSVKDALFHHSNSYLYSILFPSPASIYTVFFSLVQLLLKDSFVTPASIYTVFLFSFINPAYIYTVFIFINPASFVTPASIYAVLLSLIELILLRYSFLQFSVYLSKELFFNKFHFY